MKMTSRQALPFLLLGIASTTLGHSWIEQMSLVGSKGSYTGAYGYPRGYLARTDPGFNGFSDLWLVPAAESARTRIDNTDLACHPAQRVANQTDKYPALKVAPGSAVAMKYLENGHVSLPNNQKGKPEKGGTVFVYGTTQPKDDEKLTDILKWTSDGSGGDKRGILLGANNFDDGRCYQLNDGDISVARQKEFPDPNPGQAGSRNEQWCETDVVLPSDLKTGPYTIYWVWDWPTNPGADPTYPTGKDEYYTTCADLEVQAQEPSAPVSNELPQQDPQLDAVKKFKSRTALATSPAALRGQDVAPPASEASSMDASAASSLFTPAVASQTPSVLSSAAASATAPTMALKPFIRPAVSSMGVAAPLVPSSVQPPVVASSTQAPSSTLAVFPSPSVGADGNQTLTATLLVTATLSPSQPTIIVAGNHVLTFSIEGSHATLAPSAANAHARRHIRRSAKFRV